MQSMAGYLSKTPIKKVHNKVDFAGSLFYNVSIGHFKYAKIQTL